MQVVGDLARVKRLEEGFDNVAETDYENIELVDSLRRERVLRSSDLHSVTHLFINSITITIKADLKIDVFLLLVESIITLIRST